MNTYIGLGTQLKCNLTIWTKVNTNNECEKYINCTWYSVFIHCNRIDMILGVFLMCCRVAAGCERILCSISDLGRPPVEWTLVVARMAGQHTSFSVLLRYLWAQSFRVRAYVAKVTFFELWFRIDRGCRVFGNWDRIVEDRGVPFSVFSTVRERHDVAHWRFERRKILSANRTVRNWLSSASAAGLLAEG
jgi:hypothetical protein